MSSNADKTVPNLENATPGYLVDEIAKMRVQASRLKFLDGIYKNALQARINEQQLEGKEVITGEQFIGSFKQMTQERIDTEVVRAFFKNDPETLKRMIKIISFKQLDTSPKV